MARLGEGEADLGQPGVTCGGGQTQGAGVELADLGAGSAEDERGPGC